MLSRINMVYHSLCLIICPIKKKKNENGKTYEIKRKSCLCLLMAKLLGEIGMARLAKPVQHVFSGA